MRPARLSFYGGMRLPHTYPAFGSHYPALLASADRCHLRPSRVQLAAVPQPPPVRLAHQGDRVQGLPRPVRLYPWCVPPLVSPTCERLNAARLLCRLLTNASDACRCDRTILWLERTPGGQEHRRRQGEDIGGLCPHAHSRLVRRCPSIMFSPCHGPRWHVGSLPFDVIHAPGFGADDASGTRTGACSSRHK